MVFVRTNLEWAAVPSGLPWIHAWFDDVIVYRLQVLTVHRAILLTGVSESSQSSSLEEVEQKILQELMEVVQQRDALVALLEEDRVKSVILLLKC